MCDRIEKCLFSTGKMQAQQGVYAVFQEKYCKGGPELCAIHRVAREAGENFVSDHLYPNMHDAAERIIREAKKDQPADTGDTQRNSYIARQPVFDRNMGIYGYELCYRQGDDNFFIQTDDNRASTELVYNSFLVFGLYDLTDGTRAFIRFSKELIESESPSLLPRQSIIVEVPEGGRTAQATIDACRRIKELGYSLSLGSFIFEKENLPLLELADVVKISFSSMGPEKQAELIRKHGKRIKFLAEKLETREDYSHALELGYDFFQGYFFCKPAMLNSMEIASPGINLINILKELNTIDPSFSRIASIIQGDLGLSLKLLKLANSVYFGARNEIKSILHALSFIGVNELYQWISIMMLRDYASVEHAELIKLSFIRAKFMELLALKLYKNRNANDYFFTGMFSFIDVLINQSMEQVLKGLPLPACVTEALLGESNAQRRLLDWVIAYEAANMDEAEWQDIVYPIGSREFMSLYIDAIKWVKSLNY